MIHRIQAVVFDMDGVILDSETMVRRCWREVGPRFGLTNADELFLAQTGTSHRYLEELLRTRCGADFPVQVFLQEISRTFHAIETESGIPVRPGAQEALAELAKRGLRLGLASSTRQVIVEQELHDAGLLACFSAVVGGDRITHSKPAPDIYLAACRALGVEPSRAVAVEDSYNGIRSAAAAGLLPIMVPDQLPPNDEMRALARAVLPSLHELPDCIARYDNLQNG